MNQVKIGKFIAERRKDVNLTQAQLAEKLCITDRAVSKWERGLTMPDSSIMLELCTILKITVNDLLSGEAVSMENYNQEMENKLIEIIKEKERADKRLLRMEIVLGVCCIVPLIICMVVAPVLPLEEWKQILIVLSGLIPLLIATPFALKIEQKAGYYECKNCGHKHIPKYSSVFLAMHLGRTRYMKCPNCGKYSWQKKVISKDE